MKNLLITGLTGKSGLAFAKELSHSDILKQYRVFSCVRPSSSVQSIQNILPDITFIIGDLNDDEYLKMATKDIDILFHIAGIHYSLALVKAAILNHVKRMVLVHTTGIYSKYKAAGEEYRRIENEIEQLRGDIEITILRPTMIYGSLKDRNISVFIKMVDRLNPMPIVNRAEYSLQPVHATDLGRAYMQVLKCLDDTAGKSYILSGRDAILLIDIFRIIADELGVKRIYISVPFPIAYLGANILFFISFGKIDMREKVQRLCENRAYSHEEATHDFGYDPVAFEEGLRQEVKDYLLMKGEK